MCKGGTHTHGRMGCSRWLYLDSVSSGKPLGAFRQVDDVIGTNILLFKPTHACPRHKRFFSYPHFTFLPGLLCASSPTESLKLSHPQAKLQKTLCWLPAHMSDVCLVICGAI